MMMFILSACSLVSPVKIEPPKKYTLTEMPSCLPSKQTNGATLFVLEPETRSIYNTTSMAYTSQPHQVAFFGYNEWSETPSQMLHPLIVKTLQSTHYFHAIVVPPYSGNYDYVLSTQILKLEQDFTVKPAMLQLTIQAQLSHEMTHQVLATQEFSVQEPLLQNTPYGGVIAANHATAKILQQLAEFMLSKAK
jgi:cholesterol transport system auxiliary component